MDSPYVQSSSQRFNRMVGYAILGILATTTVVTAGLGVILNFTDPLLGKVPLLLPVVICFMATVSYFFHRFIVRDALESKYMYVFYCYVVVHVMLCVASFFAMFSVCKGYPRCPNLMESYIFPVDGIPLPSPGDTCPAVSQCYQNCMIAPSNYIPNCTCAPSLATCIGICKNPPIPPPPGMMDY